MLPSSRIDLSAHGLGRFEIRAWHIVVAALALFAGPIVGQYVAVQPWGTKILLELEMLFALPLLLGLPLCVLVMFVSPRQRRAAALGFSLCAVGFALFLAGACVARSIRHRAFEELAARGTVVVKAIEAYQSKQGVLPRDLAELTPEFLSAPPHTGLGAYPKYRLINAEEAQKSWDGNPWALCVECGGPGINFDRFIYLPLQNYPEHGYGGGLERIGSWAYVHE